MGRKSITKMTYDQLQNERDTNALAKEQLRNQCESETDNKVLLDLNQQILALAQRNERLVKQQLVLMKAQLLEQSVAQPEPEPEQITVSTTGKLKEPIDMSIEELRAEIEANTARCDELEKQKNSPDIDIPINAEQELRKLSNRTKKLCEQEISLLKHEMSILKRRN